MPTPLEKLKDAGVTAYTDAEVEALAKVFVSAFDLSSPCAVRLLVTLLEKRRPKVDEPGRYLLLSFKRGAWGNEAVWWGPHAGRYTEAEAKKIEASAPFDMGRKDTVAVPEAESFELAQLTVDFDRAVERWAIEEGEPDGQ